VVVPSLRGRSVRLCLMPARTWIVVVCPFATYVQSKRLSVRNSMNIDHPEPARKPKLQPISLAGQTLAVLMMRSQLQLKQRKSNCILLFFLVVIVVVTFLLEPGVPNSVWPMFANQAPAFRFPCTVSHVCECPGSVPCGLQEDASLGVG